MSKGNTIMPLHNASNRVFESPSLRLLLSTATELTIAEHILGGGSVGR